MFGFLKMTRWTKTEARRAGWIIQEVAGGFRLGGEVFGGAVQFEPRVYATIEQALGFAQMRGAIRR